MICDKYRGKNTGLQCVNICMIHTTHCVVVLDGYNHLNIVVAQQYGLYKY
jgi:hypothetical protein